MIDAVGTLKAANAAGSNLADVFVRVLLPDVAMRCDPVPILPGLGEDVLEKDGGRSYSLLSNPTA